MKQQLKYDVVVAGGGVAGIGAAVGAARAGARTLVIEKNPYLGGAATHSGVAAFCGFYTCGKTPVRVVGGVGEEMLRQLAALGQETGYEISPNGNATIKFEPEYLKLAADFLLEKYQVDVLFHCQLIEAQRVGNRIGTVICADGEGQFRVEGKGFVDATGDAALSHLADAGTIWGNGRGEVQVASLVFRIDGIGPEKDLSPERIGEAVRKAKADGVTGLTKESCVVIRRAGWDFGYILLPSAQLNGLDALELSRAERDMRKQVHNYCRVFRTYLPGMENCRLILSGPSLGIRESRKIIGKRRLSAADVLGARKWSDGIGRGAWKPEIHRDLNRTGEYYFIEGDGYYDIPFGVLCSEKVENLYAAGRTVSADEIAFASVRVMGTSFVTGQAAGVAAALTDEMGNPEVDSVRKELNRQGGIL